MKKVGIFSGTFDPFHVGHLEVCLVAKEACGLDTTAILLEHEPYRKNQVTPYRHRLEMIDLAIQQYPSIRLLEAPAGNITFTNTWPILQKHYGEAEYWYIMGSDLLEHIDSWHDIDDMVKHIKLCVFLRSNRDRSKVNQMLRRLRSKLPNLRYILLVEVWSEVSSSRIRQDIKTAGYSDDIDQRVLNYIVENGIYQP